MPAFFDLKLNIPKYSNFNLSHPHASSHCIGTLDPVLCEYLPTGSKVNLSVRNVVRTSPTICPVFGSLRQDYHFFFVPMRLFVPAMRLNSIEAPASDTFVDAPLPAWPTWRKWFHDDTVPNSGNIYASLHETSLMARLGYGVNAGPGGDSGVIDLDSRTINPIPIWSYYLIFYNYYANRQVPTFLQFGSTTSPTFHLDRVTTPTLQVDFTLEQMRQSLSSATLGSVNPSYYLGYETVYLCNQYFRGGLLCRSRPSDLFTTWLSSASVAAVQAYSSITVNDGKITFDQIRTSSAITGFVERIIAAGGRYLDWLTVTSGFKTSKNTDIPEYLGSTSGSIQFDMITELAGSNFGNLGGRGQGSVRSRRHRFMNSEPGFLIGIYSIIPDVLYPFQTRPWVYNTELSDFYSTALDRLTWQDVPYRWINATVPLNSSAGGDIFLQGWTNQVTIGKQPAFMEETSIPGRSSGLLATTLRYWTFGTQNPPSAAATPANVDAYRVPYVFPSQYQYIFEAPQQDNFFVYHQFDLFVKKQKSKNALPRVL